ncbi:MAG: thermonuclease family protein, partial [Desulfatiglandaceae bacterium]
MLKPKTAAFALYTLIGRLSGPGLLLFVILLVLPLASFAEEFSVIKAYNGDTIQVKGQDALFTVRLAGIDAPELSTRESEEDQPFGREAKTYLESLILNKQVSIKGYGEKSYGLMWGEVFLGKTNVNLEMLRAGYAAVYLEKSPQGLNLASYFTVEKAAMAAEKGMWVLGTNYVDPVTWRKSRKTKRSLAA